MQNSLQDNSQGSLQGGPRGNKKDYDPRNIPGGDQTGPSGPADRNSPILIILAVICLALAGGLFLYLKRPVREDGGLYGRVFQALTGEAVAGVEISATDSSGKKYDSRENTDATRQDGSFSLVLPPGQYTIQCSAAGYDDYSSASSYNVMSGKTTIIEEAILLTPSGQSAVSTGSEEVPSEQTGGETTAERAAAEEAARKAEEQEAARKAAEEKAAEAEAARKAAEEKAAQEEAARKAAEEKAAQEEAARKAAEKAAAKKAEEEAAAKKAEEEAAKKAAEEEAARQASLFSIDSSRTEDYGYNLKPEDYLSYYSGNAEFYFRYPPNLYNNASSDFSAGNTILGHNIETHTFTGSRGSRLVFSLSDRSDSLNLSSAKDKIFAQEAAEITDSRNTLLDEVSKDGFSRFVVTGYNSSGDIIYKLVKITPGYVMEMSVKCPPYNSQEDKLQKRYVQECIYRYCGFASEKPGAPRPYSDFIKDKDNQ